jgi:hypothetical protein
MMEDLFPNPNYKPPESAKSKKKKVVRQKRKATTETRSIATRSNQQVAKTPARPKKEIPRSAVSQPRDHLGRFARKTGAVLWGVAKGTVSAVAGGVKTARKAHKTVKRVQASSRRRQKLEMRERELAVKEREQKLGKKKVIRRRKR